MSFWCRDGVQLPNLGGQLMGAFWDHDPEGPGKVVVGDLYDRNGSRISSSHLVSSGGIFREMVGREYGGMEEIISPGKNVAVVRIGYVPDHRAAMNWGAFSPQFRIVEL